MASKPSSITDYRAAQAATMSEAELLANVIDAAERFGWLFHHNYDSRRSAGNGFPDLFLARSAAKRGQPGELLVVELKTQRGRVSFEQNVWLAHFQSVGIETTVWRPAQWLDGTIVARLGRRGKD